MLTQEQQLIRLLVVAVHQLGGSMDVTKQLLENVGPYNLVWEYHEDQVGIHVKTTSGQVLIGKVENDTVDVVL